MKVKAPSLLKKIIAAFSNKTNELRVRLMIFFLLHKNLDTTSLTNSLQALVSNHNQKKKNDDVVEDIENDHLVQDQHEEEEEEQGRKVDMLMNYYNKNTSMMVSDNNRNIRDVTKDMPGFCNANEYSEQSRPADLMHELFEESEAAMETECETEEAVFENGQERDGVEEEEEITEEEDIDQAADLFIQRFKKQMLLQKQRSLERQQWLLLSNA